MKIWRLKNDLNGFESIQLKDVDDDFLAYFKKEIKMGKSHKENFSLLEVEIVDQGDISDLPKFWTCSGVFVMSVKAKDSLEKLIKGCVEFIPLKCRDKVLYLVNILSIIDAINYEQARFERLSTGLVVGMEKYSFLEDKIEGLNIFITTLNGHIHSTEVFVTSEFKETVEKNNLRGFKFVEVWDSEM